MNNSLVVKAKTGHKIQFTYCRLLLTINKLSMKKLLNYLQNKIYSLIGEVEDFECGYGQDFSLKKQINENNSKTN